MRDLGKASADSAGLPILAGSVSYYELYVLQEINHALRFTIKDTPNSYLTPPATHFEGTAADPTRLDLPPMGLHLRLKSSVNCNSLGAEAKLMCNALKKYGMILADYGENWTISGVADPRLMEALLELGGITEDDFEAVDTGARLCTINDCTN